MLTTQLTVMPATELRNLLSAALGEAQVIVSKTEEKGTVGKGLLDKRQYSKGVFIGLAILVLGMLLSVLGTLGTITGARLGATTVIGVVVMIIGGAMVVGGSIKNVGKAKSQIDEELARLLQNTSALPCIPTDYWSTTALEYMIGLLDNGRATTWVQCADKYEEQVHRWTVEENTAEAVRYAESASRAAKWAAIGAWRS